MGLMKCLAITILNCRLFVVPAIFARPGKLGMFIGGVGGTGKSFFKFFYAGPKSRQKVKS